VISRIFLEGIVSVLQKDVSAPPPESFNGEEKKISGPGTDRRRASRRTKVPRMSGRRPTKELEMSGVNPGIIIGGAAVGTGVVAQKTAATLLPFTGIAVGIYIALAVGLVLLGLVMHTVGNKKKA
jgi:hypothetical protein